MPKQSISQLQNWFRTGQKPTQQQFWDWLESFWHLDADIEISDINGLQDTFDNLNLPTQAQLDRIADLDPKLVTVSGAGSYTIPVNRIVDLMIFETNSDNNFKVGKSANGNDIDEFNLTTSEPYALQTLVLSGTIHFTGTGTAKIYLR